MPSLPPSQNTTSLDAYTTAFGAELTRLASKSMKDQVNDMLERGGLNADVAGVVS